MGTPFRRRPLSEVCPIHTIFQESALGRSVVNVLKFFFVLLGTAVGIELGNFRNVASENGQYPTKPSYTKQLLQ